VSEGPQDLEVPPLLDGMRVDRVVAMLTGVSRSMAAELVAAGNVTIDGRPVPARSHVVNAGSILSVALAEEAPALSPDAGVAFEVVHEDDDLVVVDKPAGLVVHPGAGRRDGTLVNGLLARFPDVGELGTSGVCDPRRPGIVQRLDKGTSGLLVVARTAHAYESLVDQLGRRSVERRYLALVAGRVAEERGVVDAPIGRSTREPTRMTVSAQGREARTGYRVLERVEPPDAPSPMTLLSLALETGRTHQIRVHLAAIGHPVVGDDRYGRGQSVRGIRLPAGRLFLHASRLGFLHPATGEQVRWESALPGELVDALEAVRPPGGRQ
jgi:23S rRNA pseudouridine1911/1915/1917 synthase